MRSVLVLAHHFPPIGGVVRRNVATADYLPEFGFDTTVITGPGYGPDRWAPTDDGLRRRIEAMDVVRVPGPVPDGHKRHVARIARWAERPAPWVRWWVDGVVDAARRLDRPYDAILANCFPYETSFAAAALSRELGIPWVADLEDPWALDEMRVAPSNLNYRIDLAKMRRGLGTATAIIMNCDEAAARLRGTLPDLGARAAPAITHGFSADDFAGDRPQRSDSAFRIVHTGSLHTQLGYDHRATARARRLMRGTSLNVDILTRSLVFLLEAIERLGQFEPELAARIELHLVGNLTGADRALVDRNDFVRSYGHQPHHESIAIMRSADLLFLPMHELPPGERAGIVPCKSYEYLAAERPLLAAVPDGDGRDLLRRFDRVSVVRPSDVAAMTEALRDRMLVPERGVGIQRRDAEPLRRYERRYLAGRIAGVLDGVLGAAPQLAHSAA